MVSYGLDLFWPLRMGLALGVGFAMYVLVEKRIMAMRAKPRSLRPTRQLQEA